MDRKDKKTDQVGREMVTMTTRAVATEKMKGGPAPKFWNFIDNGDAAELQLFGTISSEESWWDDDCVTYRNFINELNALGEKKSINVTIQSGGGDVFAANAIYTALMTNKATITGTVIGICASAATIVLMACDKREIAKNAILMVHNPSIGLFGHYQAEDLLKLAEVTDQVKKSILTAYMDRLDKPEDEIRRMMDEESWYVGQEAVDAGFCDGVIEAGVQDNAFSNSFEVDGRPCSFQNYLESFVPEAVRKKVRDLSERPSAGKLKGFFSAASKKTEGRTKMDEKDMTISDVTGLRAAYPQLCDQIAADAVMAERERLKAIDEIAAGIPGDLLTKAKYGEPMSAADLALAQMKANAAAGQQFLAGMAADMQDSGASAVSAEPNGGVDDAARLKAESEEKVNGLANTMKKDKRRG